MKTEMEIRTMLDMVLHDYSKICSKYLDGTYSTDEYSEQRSAIFGELVILLFVLGYDLSAVELLTKIENEAGLYKKGSD